MTILDGVFFGLLITVIAVVAVSSCYLVVLIFEGLLFVKEYLESVYKRWLWRRKSPAERARITRELMLYMPSSFPLEQISKQFNSIEQPEYEWKEKYD